MELEENANGALVLNVRFDFKPIAVDLPGVSPGPWHFHFTDCPTSQSFTEIKHELTNLEEKDEYFIAVVLFESPQTKKLFFPHRFKVRVLEAADRYTREEFREAITAALGRVMTEMEIQLRQSCHRACDPQIGYGKVLNLRHQEIAMTHRTRFIKES